MSANISASLILKETHWAVKPPNTSDKRSKLIRNLSEPLEGHVHWTHEDGDSTGSHGSVERHHVGKRTLNGLRSQRQCFGTQRYARISGFDKELFVLLIARASADELRIGNYRSKNAR